jgi:putative membrane protein
MFLKESNYSFWFVLRLFRKEMLVMSIVTIAISFLDNYITAYSELSMTVPALLGTALSLILAFRTGQAYDRWWEARKVWGEIINDSRSLVRATLGYIRNHAEGEGKEFVTKLARRQIAWVYALGSTLRKQDAFILSSDFLSKEERASVKENRNIPNAILVEHSLQIKEGNHRGMFNDFAHTRLDEIVMRLTDSMGKCERIKNTVFPTPYTRIVHFIIYVFAVALILGIQDDIGIVEIPVTIIITMVFFALERIAIILQDPFENNPSDIPVTAIARTIEIDLKQMIGDENIPQPINPVRNFLM